MKSDRKKILGNKVCGVWPYVTAITINALIHLFLFFVHKSSYYDIIQYLISFIFFTYPICFIIDELWALRPSVVKIITGKKKVNRLHYMNVARTNILKQDLLEVTISIPVYLEENKVIFETLYESLKATENYTSYCKKKVNIIVSDDGLASLLKNSCSKEVVNNLINEYDKGGLTLTKDVIKAIERIKFYRKYNIGFVVRPTENRAGLFKKASNLNYTLRFGDELEKTKSIDMLVKKGGLFEGGYAEGDVITKEIILLLDKDSGVNKKIIKAIIPEFAFDDKLAYVQCATNTKNINDNNFANAMAHQNNNLFHTIWPCMALKGYFVPLIGHNAFIRKSTLKENNYWDENKVSEDFDIAIKLNASKYHGKYAQIKGLEFTEYVSRTFTEETSKEYRYTYGLFEMMFDGTVKFGETRKYDLFYMIIYFFSKIYMISTIPYTLFVTFIGDINIMWAGFLVSQAGFILIPYIRSVIVRKRLGSDNTFSLKQSLIISFSYLGHAYSILSGASRYVLNKFKKVKKGFPSTSVSTINYCFSEGIFLMNNFIANNIGYLLIVVFFTDRVVSIATRTDTLLITKISCSYILIGIMITPFLMTPHFYHVNRKRKNVLKGANLTPITLVFCTILFLPIISFNFYEYKNKQDELLNSYKKIKIPDKNVELAYTINNIRPGQTKKIKFEIDGKYNKKMLDAKRDYSILIKKNNLPFTYRLECTSDSDRCISGNEIIPGKKYKKGLIPLESDLSHKYILYVTWPRKMIKTEEIDKLNYAYDVVKYKLLSEKYIRVKIIPKDYIYEISEIENQDYIRNSSNNINIKINATESLINRINVYVDNILISKNEYDINSNIITLNSKYLNSLENGKHKVKIKLSNKGVATAVFSIQ